MERQFGPRDLHVALATAAAVLLLAGCRDLARSAATAAAAPATPAAEVATLAANAEALLKDGDCRHAAETYARATRSGDATVARRATEVAMGCEHVPAAWQSASRWRVLAPADREANALYAAVALKQYRLAEARTGIHDFWMASGNAVAATSTPEGAARTARAMAQLSTLLLAESDAPAVSAAMSGAVPALVSQSPGALVVLAELALAAYDGKRAEGYAREALRQDARDPAALRVLARSYVMRGDPEQAIATARAAQAVDAVSGTFTLVEVLAALDRNDEARRELQGLRPTAAPGSEIDRRLGVIALEEGDLRQARERFEAVLRREGPNDAVQLQLAEIALREGNKDAALAQYRRLYDSQVALAARIRAAGLLLERGARQEALVLLDDFSAEHPEDELELTLAKARLLADHGAAEDGLAALAAALERHPQHPAIEYDQAVILEQAGRVPQSVAALRGLLARRPDDPTLLNALGYTLADHRLDLSRAEALIRRALQVMPDSPAALDSLGWVRFRAGDAAAAATLLQRAYSLDHNAEIAAHWGEALWVSGRQEEARKVWAAAQAHTSDSRQLKATIARLSPDAAR